MKLIIAIILVLFAIAFDRNLINPKYVEKFSQNIIKKCTKIKYNQYRIPPSNKSGVTNNNNINKYWLTDISRLPKDYQRSLNYNKNLNEDCDKCVTEDFFNLPYIWIYSPKIVSPRRNIQPLYSLVDFSIESVKKQRILRMNIFH